MLASLACHPGGHGTGEKQFAEALRCATALRGFPPNSRRSTERWMGPVSLETIGAVMSYSYLSATMGSTRRARRAGR